MNKILKKLLLGLIIWVIPFAASFFVWDVANNMPSVSYPWFYALMGFTGAVGFAIAACLYFRKIKNPVKEGWMTGLTWYIELLVLDLIVLVGLMGMSFSGFYHLFLTYLSPFALAVAVGYVLKNK